MPAPDLTGARIETVDEHVIESLRRLSPADSVALINDANRTARALLAAGIKHRHPDWSTPQVEQEVARRMLGAAS